MPLIDFLQPSKNSILFIVFLFIWSSDRIHSQCAGTDLVQDPVDFQWTFHPVTANNPQAYYSGVLEVGEETFIMNNGATLTTRAYRQQGGSYNIPGPTIKMTPGNKYILQFHNTLPFESLNPNHNIFKDPNASNIHTHGLHISGEGAGDDITRVFEGQRGGDFVWDIPADHMGGTFWYHAHHHGSSFLQVSGGLFGLMIIDDSNDGIPSTVAGMTERELIFGFLDPAAAGTGGDVLLSGTLSPTWTVNGLVAGNADICLPPNTWQHWRMLLADRAANIKTLEFGPGCEVMLLARDGVWRTMAPKDLTALNSNQLELTGASRADIAIRVSGPSSWIRINGTDVATIHIDGTSDTSVHPWDTDGSSLWSAIRPDYLRDLRNETNVNFESVKMGARTINGSKYDHANPNISLTATQVQEWSITGAVQHPFHLHIYHVQALADDGDFEAGEFYDVVSAKMSVRFDLNTATTTPYDGRTIMHCHILSHEDQGAMGWLDVDGGALPPTYPADGDITQPYSLYYMLGGGQQPPAAPGNLAAATISSAAIDLTWDDNSTDEDGFDIERSLDGTNFNFLTSVGPDNTAYTDNGLNPSTTYWYRVLAYNTGGSSVPSNVANATTQASGGGPTMHVENIIVTREALNGNRFRGVATVTILDDLGAAVSGATVSGDFTGPNSNSKSGTTDGSGQATINSNGQKNPVGEWCFEVTNVSLTGATYDSASNVVTQACESGPVFFAKGIFSNNSTSKRSIEVNPNPFWNSTQILFELENPSDIRMEVYNIFGERVGAIANGYYNKGNYSIEWEADNLNNGTYFLIFKKANLVKTEKLILIR